MTNQNKEIPIVDLDHSDLLRNRGRLAGWSYPKRNISPFTSLFSKPQQAAINLYAWIAILMIPAGIGVSIYMKSWLWLLLIPGAVIVWKANRKSMEEFFLENLIDDQSFYDKVRSTEMGTMVKAVFRDE